ncbi:MAG TPA: FecR domain-containing protein, partial [Nitrospiria bacterium]|nr:FecR domain-containing protein [Nitrospiria bacterium]
MRIRLLHVAVLTVIFTGIPISGSANPIECKDWVARIVSVEGRVESLKADETDWKEVLINNTYCPEDKIRTLEKSRVALLLPNETILRLDQKTTVKFSATKKSTLLEIITGRAFFMSRTPQAFTIETPFVNAASEGTEFMIEVNEEARSATVTVIEGKMAVTNETGSITVKSGQEALIKAGQLPILRILVRPADAIQWALYYPPVLSIRELKLDMVEGLPDGDWRLMVRRSIESYMEGNIEKSFSVIEAVPKEINDPRFYTYRASLLLSVGQVDKAGNDIQKALSLAPGYSPALALQSIIAVAQNEKDKALRFALEATRAGPDSVSAKIALSYAYQANFNLPEASAATKEAVRLDPQSSLAWARLAELLMSEEDLDKALDAAKMAVAINPKEARAQMVLGFAYLAQIKTKDSKNAFEKAITLNQADPLSRLGLGLTMIREGDLEEGRKE